MRADVEQSELRCLQSVLSRETKEQNEENEMIITEIHVLGFLIQFFMNFIK